MDRQQLERTADKIETVLLMNHTPAQVTGGHVTPRWVQFNVSLASKRVDRVEALTTQIAAALGVPYATITRAGGAVRIDVPRNDPQPVLLANMIKRLPASRVPPCTAVVGLADDGAPLLARFPAASVGHMRIIGNEGSGKTSLMIAMLLSLAYYNKPRHVKIVAMGSSFDELARLINRPSTDPRIFVAIDEPRPIDLQVLRAMIECGAAAGVHCIVAARESIDLPFGVTIKADTQRARSQQPGDFWAEYNKAGVIRFDAAHIAAHEIGSFIQAMMR